MSRAAREPAKEEGEPVSRCPAWLPGPGQPHLEKPWTALADLPVAERFPLCPEQRQDFSKVSPCVVPRPHGMRKANCPHAPSTQFRRNNLRDLAPVTHLPDQAGPTAIGPHTKASP